MLINYQQDVIGLLLPNPLKMVIYFYPKLSVNLIHNLKHKLS